MTRVFLLLMLLFCSAVSLRVNSGLTKLNSKGADPKFKVDYLRGGNLPVHDLTVSLVVLGESLVWLKVWTTLAKEGILDSKITRKIIHSGSAPLFMAHWPLYSPSPSAKYIAAAVPLLQVIRLYLAGTRADSATTKTATKSENSKPEKNISDLIQAVSRTGNKAEALGGPLIYSIVLLLATAIFFRNSPVGIVAIAQMAAGDGVADIIGRRYGKTKWPFAPSKSIAGTTAFVVAGFLVSCALLALMAYTGTLDINVVDKAPIILGISVFSAMVELVPGVDDNISVPLAAALTSAAFL